MIFVRSFESPREMVHIFSMPFGSLKDSYKWFYEMLTAGFLKTLKVSLTLDNGRFVNLFTDEFLEECEELKPDKIEATMLYDERPFKMSLEYNDKKNLKNTLLKIKIRQKDPFDPSFLFKSMGLIKNVQELNEWDEICV